MYKSWYSATIVGFSLEHEEALAQRSCGSGTEDRDEPGPCEDSGEMGQDGVCGAVPGVLAASGRAFPFGMGRTDWPWGSMHASTAWMLGWERGPIRVVMLDWGSICTLTASSVSLRERERVPQSVCLSVCLSAMPLSLSCPPLLRPQNQSG